MFYFTFSLFVGLSSALFSDLFKNYKIGDFYFLFITVIVFSLLAGLRTEYNDTETYIYNFVYNIPTEFDQLNILSFTIGENRGFYLYQYLIKSFISEDPHVFIFLSSLITNLCFIAFFYRNSRYISILLFLFVTGGLYILSFAALKQTMAMGIGLYGFKYFTSRKHLTFFAVLCIAASIHPFVLLYSLAYIFDDKVWSIKVVILLFCSLLIGAMFIQFVGIVLNASEHIGVKYDPSYILDKQGMNLFRVAVFASVPILTFIFRGSINLSRNRFLIVASNFSILAFLLSIIASYGGANMFGRLAYYFVPFSYIALVWIALHSLKKKFRFFFMFSVLLAYSLFFYFQMFVVKSFTYINVFTQGGQ